MHTLIQQIELGQSLTQAQAYEAFDQLLLGKVAEEEVAKFLLTLKARGESIEEITGAAEAMRDAMRLFDAPDDAMDVCGTGGDAKGTYNISTTVAIVLAACGVPVVKHGNRAVSSQSGSSDVLSELGVGLSDDDDALHRCLEHANICYLAAPLFHPAMKHVTPVRAKLKTRTIFNLLGPLCNPARVKYQLMGVYDAALCKPLALVLDRLGSKAAAVVHGADGLDELSVSGASHVSQLLGDKIYSYEITPEKAGLPTYAPEALLGGDAAHNAKSLTRLLMGEDGAYRDAVLLNVAAALIVADKAEDLASGVALAAEAIDSGRAHATLTALVQYSN